MNEIQVLIAAQDPLARAGLAALLQTEPSLYVIGQISPDNPTLDAFSPHVLLFDLGWEFETDLTPLTDSPMIELQLPLLVLLPDESAAPTVCASLQETGQPYGVLARATPIQGVTAALHALVNGLAVLSPSMMQPLTQMISLPNPSATPTPPEALTPREQEVLLLLAEGLPNKTIARRLHISEYTVKFHVNAILSKLNAGSRTEAVVRATRLGLISL